jgi:uroporphyrinogen-III synthase
MTGPLSGKRIVVTRSPEQAETMGQKLAALGAAVIYLPAIDFVPLPAPDLDNALANLSAYAWLIFTSSNAVRFFWERLEESPLPVEAMAQVRTAAVGSATTLLLVEKGVRVDFTPAEFTGQQLVLGLGSVTGQRVLLPRAKIGRPEIIALLRERGAIVEDVALYDTVTADPDPEALAELEKGVDVLTFTSPSSVRNFLTVTQFGKLRHAITACIGPSTALEAEKQGLRVTIIPDDYTIDGLVTAVADYYRIGRR